MWKEISKESTKCWTRFWFTSRMIFVCVFLYPRHYDALIAWFKFSNSTVQCFIFYGFLLKTNCSNIWPHVDQSIFSLKYWIYRSVWKKYQRVDALFGRELIVICFIEKRLRHILHLKYCHYISLLIYLRQYYFEEYQFCTPW